MPIQKSNGTAPVVARRGSTPVWVVVRDAAGVGGIGTRVVEDPAAGLFRGGLSHTQERIGGVDWLGAGIGYVSDAGGFGNDPAHARPLRVRPRGKIATADAEVHAVIRDPQIGGASGILLDELIEQPAARRTE